MSGEKRGGGNIQAGGEILLIATFISAVSVGRIMRLSAR